MATSKKKATKKKVAKKKSSKKKSSKKKSAKKKSSKKKSAKKKSSKKKTAKTRAKKTAKKVAKKTKEVAKEVAVDVEKGAKTDVGRAGIGAGVGALALGPIGAVAGVYVGLKTKKKKKKAKKNPGPGLMLVRSKAGPPKPPRKTMAREIYRMTSRLRNKNAAAAKRILEKHKPTYQFLQARDINVAVTPRNQMYSKVVRLHSELLQKVPEMNPGPMVKISATMGSMLLDYHRADRAIEHVAAAALRGEPVELSYVITTRNKLAKLAKLQPSAAEKEQINDIVESLDRSKGMPSARRKQNGHRAGREKPARKAKTAARSKPYVRRGKKATGPHPKRRNPESATTEGPIGLRSRVDAYLKARKRWEAITIKLDSGAADIARAKKRADDAERALLRFAKIMGVKRASLERHIKAIAETSTPSRRLVAGGRVKKSLSKTMAKRKRTPNATVVYDPLTKRHRAAVMTISSASRPSTASKLTKRYGKKVIEDIIQHGYIVVSKNGKSLQATAKGSRLAVQAHREMEERALARLPRGEAPYHGGTEREEAEALETAGWRKEAEASWRHREVPREEMHGLREGHRADNPLGRVSEGTTDKRFRSIISRNISREIKSGARPRQAVAIALSTARKQAPVKTTKIYGPYSRRVRRQNPCIGLHFHSKDAAELLEAAEKAALRQAKMTKKTTKKKNPQGGSRVPWWEPGGTPTPADRRKYTVPAPSEAAMVRARKRWKEGKDVSDAEYYELLNEGIAASRPMKKNPEHRLSNSPGWMIEAYPVGYLVGAKTGEIGVLVYEGGVFRGEGKFKGGQLRMGAGPSLPAAVRHEILQILGDKKRVPYRNPLTAKQKKFLRERTKESALLLESGPFEEEAYPLPSSKKSRPIPPGTKVTRVPPGAAAGSEPLHWNPRGEIAPGLGVPMRLRDKGKKAITEWKRWHKRGINSAAKRRPSEADNLARIHESRAAIVDAIYQVVRDAGAGGIGNEELINKVYNQLKSDLAPRVFRHVDKSSPRHYARVLKFFGVIKFSGGKWRAVQANPESSRIKKQKYDPALGKYRTFGKKPKWARSAAMHGLRNAPAWYVKFRQKGQMVVEREDGYNLVIQHGNPQTWFILDPTGVHMLEQTSSAPGTAPSERAVLWADTTIERLTDAKGNLKKRAKKNPHNASGSPEALRLDPTGSYPDGVINRPNETFRGEDSSGTPVLAVRVGTRWANVHPLRSGAYGVRWWMRKFELDELGIKAKNPKKASKKKTAKKKTAARKKTPAYQLLINRCQKLWTHYCARPSKKRLEELYAHLDKMKESTSKKVAAERSRCMRSANAEAKKLKYKRKK